MPSFRLVILGSLARAVAVLETVEQLGGLEATAPGKSAGLGDLEAVDRSRWRRALLVRGGIFGFGGHGFLRCRRSVWI